MGEIARETTKEIVLCIHCDGKDPEEISAVTNLTVVELIAVLVSEFRLPLVDGSGRSITYELHSEDAGSTLLSENTLEMQYVRSGQNLILRPLRKPFHSPPIPKVRPIWLLIPIVCLLAGGFIGFFSGWSAAARKGNLDLQKQRDAAQVSVSSLGSDLQKAKDMVAQVTKERDDIKANAGEIDKQREEVSGQLNKSKATLTSLKIDRAAKTNENSQLKADLEATRTQLSQAQSGLAQTRSDNLTLGQQLERANNEIRDLKARISTPQRPSAPSVLVGTLVWTGSVHNSVTVDLNGNHVNKGSVTGSLLPGRPCTIQPLDANVQVLIAPGAGNWKRLKFRVDGAGQMSVRFRWSCPQ